MAELKIYRGADQIGGGCIEIAAGGERILIDFGANLPDADESAAVKDAEMKATVFDGRPAKAVLFTHYHGDHYGLYKEIPKGVPMYIGPLAKQILQVLVPRLDRKAEVKGAPIVKRMKPYRARHWMNLSPNFSVLPLYVDHSALDAYMLYIQAAGKKILFTGDFRTHGIQNERGQLWSALERYVVPGGVDVLVTEGTMLSRTEEARENPVQTERDLGREALKKFRKHKYNFVMLSSTNLDSLMMFYHYTPRGMQFVCDSYQAQVMLTAMKGMEKKEPRWYQRSPYQPAIYIWRSSRGEDLSEVEQMGAALAQPIRVLPADGGLMSQRGFVFLTRKNSIARGHRGALNTFYPLDGSRDAQLIYSMWKGYLYGPHRDKELVKTLEGRKPVPLHTSGHAYIDAIAQLIGMVDPKVIVPMHTECAQEFKNFPEFARWKDRVRAVTDGQVLPLET